MQDVTIQGAKLVVRGALTFPEYENLKKEFKNLRNVEIIDLSEIKKLDTSGALLLIQTFPDAQLIGITEDLRKLFELVRERTHTAHVPIREGKRLTHIIEIVGKWSEDFFKNILSIVHLLGETVSSFSRLITFRKSLRPKEFSVQLSQALTQGVGLVALVTSLIGLVVAYLFASQAQKFGAYIFVVEAVTIAMCRELSPVVVAILVAARSGSSYTAQIGAMKLNQEIDAIRVMGLSPFIVLVFPRVLALLLSLPLLTFVGNIAGVGGGLIVSNFYLDITPITFIERMHRMVALKHIIVGFLKAPFFALAISVIGCSFGLESKSDARSVGLNTTASVVYAVVTVIIIDAFFAVLFQSLGI